HRRTLRGGGKDRGVARDGAGGRRLHRLAVGEQRARAVGVVALLPDHVVAPRHRQRERQQQQRDGGAPHRGTSSMWAAPRRPSSALASSSASPSAAGTNRKNPSRVARSNRPTQNSGR